MFDGEYPEIDPLQLKSQKPVEFSAKNCWPAIPRIPAILMFARGTRFWPIPDTCPNMARHWLDKRTAGKLLRLVCHAQRFLGARVPMAVTWHTPNAPRQALNFWDGPCLDNLSKKTMFDCESALSTLKLTYFGYAPFSDTPHMEVSFYSLKHFIPSRGWTRHRISATWRSHEINQRNGDLLTRLKLSLVSKSPFRWLSHL